MKPGQRLTLWWQQHVLGRLTSPQALYLSARYENPDAARGSDRFLSEAVEGVRWDAPERLKAPFFMLSEPSLKQWDKADWTHVDKRLMRWSALFIELARHRGIPLYVHTALRGEADQNKANALGHSKAAYPMSAHNIGEAVDIVHGVYHWNMTKQEWSLLHVLGLRALDLVNAQLPVKPPLDAFGNPRPHSTKLALTWGGDEGPSDPFRWDPAHWEITDFRSRRRPLPQSPPTRYTPRSILARIKL